MREKIVIFVILLLTIGLAQADWPGSEKQLRPGDLLEITVGDLPAETQMASFSLGHGVHGLLMQRQADGSWQGRFAVLPALAGKTLEPMVTARLADGRELVRVLPKQKVGNRPVKDGDGFVTTAENDVLFVFDETIQMDSVEVQTVQGSVLTRPRYQNNYFTLPAGVSQNDVKKIKALSVHGEELAIIPDDSI